MTQTKREKESGTLSHFRFSKNKYGERIMVPVIDVRDGDEARRIAYSMIKSSKSNSFFKQNAYNTKRESYDASM